MTFSRECIVATFLLSFAFLRRTAEDLFVFLEDPDVAGPFSTFIGGSTTTWASLFARVSASCSGSSYIHIS